MLNFTNCKELLNDYSGSEKKIKIEYENENYMLKFPDPMREKNGKLSYINNQFSEYIGCHIAKELGIPVQDTKLGVYEVDGKTKICVACRDFSNDGLTLYEFSKLANSVTSSDSKFTTTIEDVYEVINKYSLIKNKQSIIEGFWDIFVVDCLIGNPDRHLDNWGVVEDKYGNISVSPIYDCGSCLFPLYSEEQMLDLLHQPNELKNLSFNVSSAYKLNNHRLFYRDISKIDNPDFRKSLYKVGKNINLDRIQQIIQDTPYLSDIYKDVFMKSIEIRYNTIMKKEIEKLILKSEKEIEKNITDDFKDREI